MTVRYNSPAYAEPKRIILAAGCCYVIATFADGNAACACSILAAAIKLPGYDVGDGDLASGNTFDFA